MNGKDNDDLLTELNTQLNKSMVLMESPVDGVSPHNKSNRSITINTEKQPRKASNTSTSHRKSILKKSDKANNETLQDSNQMINENFNNVSNSTVSRTKSSETRPRSLQDLAQEETLVSETTTSTFNLDDLSDNEEIWIMDMPRTIDPHELKGQTLTLGDKTKFKVGEERYYAVNHDVKCNVTYVFHTGKVKSEYKTVNVKPIGSLSVRRKLSSAPKIKPIPAENASVPFPENLKLRHPLFGVVEECNVKKESKAGRHDGKHKAKNI